MRASRNDRLGVALGLALAASLVPLGSGFAQLGPPVRLVPRPSAPLESPATDQAPSSPSGIQATPLAPVDASWAGSLAAGDGAFPETLWEGTPRSFVAAALTQLQPTTSPVLQDLGRRLLLSNARPPPGADPAEGPGLALLRLDRLVALGRVDDALAIAEGLPARGNPEPLDRLKVQLHFLANDADGACQRVQEAIGRYQEVWWDRALVACQALAGDSAKAVLGLNLLRERKEPRDPVFDALIDAVGGRATKIEHMADPTPIRIALLAAAKLPLPGDALQTADPAVLHAWATNGKIPADRRLAAAEQAAMLGSIPLQVLRDTYAEISFKPEERKTARDQPGETPRGRALLYEIARQDSAPASRVEALQALLQAGRKRGDYPVTAELVAPLILELRPSADLAEFAPEAARVFYSADRPLEARQWLQVAGPAAAALFPIARLAQGSTGPPWPKNGLKPALDALQPEDGTTQPGKLLLATALLAALGEPVTPADWAPLVAISTAPAGPLPNVALWIDQREAAGNRRLGETVLATLLLAGMGGRLTTEPVAMVQAVTGLRAAGLETEARHLALEAALDAGL